MYICTHISTYKYIHIHLYNEHVRGLGAFAFAATRASPGQGQGPPRDHPGPTWAGQAPPNSHPRATQEPPNTTYAVKSRQEDPRAAKRAQEGFRRRSWRPKTRPKSAPGGAPRGPPKGAGGFQEAPSTPEGTAAKQRCYPRRFHKLTKGLFGPTKAAATSPVANLLRAFNARVHSSSPYIYIY